MTGLANLPSLDEGLCSSPVVVVAEVAHPSRATSATPLATLPTWGERRNTGRGPWRPFDGSEPDVDPDTGDERATTDAEGRPL